MKYRRKVIIIVVTIALVTVFHYAAPNYLSFFHELLERFYYIPIILSGLWFGAVGGLVASLAVTFAYLPHVWMAWGGENAILLGKLLEVSLFNLAGPLTGVLSDRARRQREKNRSLRYSPLWAKGRPPWPTKSRTYSSPSGAFFEESVSISWWRSRLTLT